MLLFDNLPQEINQMIMDYKIEIETSSIQSFLEDFEITLIKQKETKTLKGDIRMFTSTLHLLYKPTQKCIIYRFNHIVFIFEECTKPILQEVIETLMFECFLFKEGDWTYTLKLKYGEWKRDYSYNAYIQHWKNTSYSEYVYLRNIVKKLEIVLEDRFDKFIECFKNL